MNRGTTGRYETTVVAGERVSAFVPDPLPPKPPLALDAPLHAALEAATLSVGRLDGVSSLVPDVSLFLYSYVRKEAVLSSQIEGIQSSLSDLLMYELDEPPGVPLEDVIEVSNYVAALQHGIDRLFEGFPISNRLIRELHGVLLSRGRGSGKDPGEFRRSQNWIGGTRPGDAKYVPPPHQLVADCMSDLEKAIHDRDSLPLLIRTALAHVQFEAIHPFLDGNGRVGRLLITLMLSDAGALRHPMLYLSFYFRANRSRYYDLLDLIRRDGDWETWLMFFLEGVRSTAEDAVLTARTLSAMFAGDSARVARLGRRAASTIRVHEALKERPLATLPDLSRRTGLSFPAVSSAVSALVDMEIAREISGRRRNRLFSYGRYMDVLTA